MRFEELTPSFLVHAYTQGAFPMAEHRQAQELQWYSPDPRTIIPLNGLHVGRSLRKVLRSNDFIVRFDDNFEAMIDLCASPAPGREETWINPAIRNVFTELYHLGLAHSVECWDRQGLAGGLYGLALGGAFFGESMVSRRPNASKVALFYLVETLRHCGFSLLDTQFMTDHLQRMGAINISHDSYMGRLRYALSCRCDFPRRPSPHVLDSVLA